MADERQKTDETGDVAGADGAVPTEARDESKPMSASDEMPPHVLQEEDPHQRADGSNAPTHHPDPDAEAHRATGDGQRVRGPYVTGNW